MNTDHLQQEAIPKEDQGRVNSRSSINGSANPLCLAHETPLAHVPWGDYRVRDRHTENVESFVPPTSFLLGEQRGYFGDYRSCASQIFAGVAKASVSPSRIFVGVPAMQ